MTERTWSTVEGRTPYIAMFKDKYGNNDQRHIPRPAAAERYFTHANKIDVHNHHRQHILGLELLWDTRDGFFRINTTCMGITLTDAWRLFTYPFRKNAAFSKNDRLNPNIRLFTHRAATSMISRRWSQTPGRPIINIPPSVPPPSGDNDDDSRRNSAISELTAPTDDEASTSARIQTRSGQALSSGASVSTAASGSSLATTATEGRELVPNSVQNPTRPAVPPNAPHVPAYILHEHKGAKLKQPPNGRARAVCKICGAKVQTVCVTCGEGYCCGAKKPKSHFERHCLYLHACQCFVNTMECTEEYRTSFQTYLEVYRTAVENS